MLVFSSTFFPCVASSITKSYFKNHFHTFTDFVSFFKPLEAKLKLSAAVTEISGDLKAMVLKFSSDYSS
jgi:hypothetical protein